MPGKVKIRYYGYLAGEFNGEVEVEIPDEGATVEEVVKLPSGLDIKDLVLLVNGKPAKPDTRVKPGDTIAVMPHIGGG